jgi:hypothetical protein
MDGMATDLLPVKLDPHSKSDINWMGIATRFAHRMPRNIVRGIRFAVCIPFFPDTFFNMAGG